MRRRLLLAALPAAIGVAVVATVLATGSVPIAPGRADSPQPSGSSLAASLEPAPPSTTPAASAAPPPTPGPTIPPPPAVTSLARRQLQEAVDELRAAEGIPGVSAAIVFPDGTTWTGVSGLADVAAGSEVEPGTAFAAASISKTFLAALVLDLAAEGRFGLEDRAGEYLPELPIVRTVTIRQLLDHTSGLHDYFLDPRIDRALLADRGRAWTAAQTLRYVGRAYFPPGTGWHYSNTNYLVLGLLAERVGGASIATQLQDRYFEPLGLTATWYQGATEPAAPLAHGYRFDGPGKGRPPIDLADGSGIVPFRSVVTAAGGAGSIAASALDLARWGAALYGDRATQPGTLALMLAGVDRVAGYRPGVPYGLGVQVVSIDGHLTYGHSGRFLGFRSAVRYLPEAGITIAVMTNQSRVDPGPILARLLRIVLPPPGPCGVCPVPF
jgi:D-alanyl-D-alanine carboxypeptidase